MHQTKPDPSPNPNPNPNLNPNPVWLVMHQTKPNPSPNPSPNPNPNPNPNPVWLVMHPNEALRTTNSGKLLLLAHPDATLLIGGIPAHEAILHELVRRPKVRDGPLSQLCSPSVAPLGRPSGEHMP